MRIDRLLSIIVMLLNNNRISAGYLAEKYEVSRRTIYRDIDAINLSGIPVISFPGNSGGFGIMENYKIDRQVLTLKDMISIISALKGINAALEDIELDAAINKIISLVPKEKTELLELQSENIVFDILPWGHRKSRKNLLKIINDCIVKNIQINIDYINTQEENSNRTIEPMTLLFKGYTWYLFAFCNLKNDYRIFRISRVKALNVLEKKFIRRKKSYIEVLDKKNKTTELDNIILKFKKNQKVSIQDYFDENSIQYLDNGDLIVKMQFPKDDPWIYNMILGYADDVEVLEPEHLRENIKKKLKQILNNYLD